MKDSLLYRAKKVLDYMAVIGVFYILMYQIKVLREIGKAIGHYLIDWFWHTDIKTLKRFYAAGEDIFKIIIVTAIVISAIIKVMQCTNERKLKKIKGNNRFEESLLKYLQDKSVLRAFLITGKWGSGKTYEVNNFFNKYYKFAKTKVYRISCFGLNSRKELIAEIQNVIEQSDDSIYTTTIKVLQCLPVIGEALNRVLKKSYEYNSLKEGTVFIFDDFERITSRSLIAESPRPLYRQSPHALRHIKTGDSGREFQDIKQEFRTIESAFSQVDGYFLQHWEREDYDKYIAVIGLVNELVETYGCKVIIVCNSDMLGEKFVHDVLRSKLNCIEYKKVITAEVRIAVIDNILKSRIFEDEDKQQCISSYIDLIKDNIEGLMLDAKFNDLRLFGGLLEAFIDTAMLFEKETLTKEFLNSLLNSILIVHLAYYNNIIEKVDLYVNGANIEFLLQVFGGPIDRKNLIRLSYNSEEVKWVDVAISGYWIFNLAMPQNMTERYHSWKDYRFLELEDDLLENYDCLEENKGSLIHILFYQKKQGSDRFGNRNRVAYIKNALQDYDLKSEAEVKYVLDVTYDAFEGRYYQEFFKALYEVIEQEYGDTPLFGETYLYGEYNHYVKEKREG